MDSPNPTTLLEYQLSDQTRKERRNLLIASVVAFLAWPAGIIPRSIHLEGIDFPQADPRWYILLVTAAVAYFQYSFWVYANADKLRWKHYSGRYHEDVARHLVNWSYEDQKRLDELNCELRELGFEPAQQFGLHAASKRISGFKTFLELWLPSLIGIVAMTCTGAAFANDIKEKQKKAAPVQPPPAAATVSADAPK